MKTIESLQDGDFIAFPYSYLSNEPKMIMVARITKKFENNVLVHFTYGHHSVGEFIKYEDIVAIGDNSATGKIRGFGGSYNILKPENEIFIQNNAEV